LCSDPRCFRLGRRECGFGFLAALAGHAGVLFGLERAVILGH
jgi:hypothetical protein